MPRILFFFQSAFSMWMIVDAIRRGAAYYWYPVILMPFGEFVYFFVVKVQDPEFDGIRDWYRKLTTPKVTLDERRHRAEQSPSYANTAELAQALYDEGHYREAAEVFAEALELHDDSREALYGLALARSALRDFEPAIAGFRRLIELDPSFRDYAAYTDLAHALSESGRLQEAFDLLAGLVEKSPRLRHRVTYAHYLLASGARDAAREQLEAGLRDHKHAPKYVKRKSRAWARRAKQMLKQT